MTSASAHGSFSREPETSDQICDKERTLTTLTGSKKQGSRAGSELSFMLPLALLLAASTHFLVGSPARSILPFDYSRERI